MKKTLIYISAIVLGLCSCQKQELAPMDKDSQSNLTIKLNIGGLQTKGVIAGEDELNENRLIDVDIFLYSSEDENESAKVHKHILIEGANQQQRSELSHNINLRLFGTDLAALGYKAGQQTTFYIYAIGNKPDDVKIDGTESISTLNKLAIEAPDPIIQKQDYFTMRGKGEATGGAGMEGFLGSVILERVMSKFGISVIAEDSYVGEVDGIEGTWTPVEGSAAVKLFGLTTKGVIGGDPQSKNIDIDNPRSVPAAYYSFPVKCLPEDKPYYIISLAWTNGEYTKETYYKVICDYETFASNTFYRLNAYLSYPGSTKEPKPIIVSPDELDYSVADWNSGAGDDGYNTEAVIKDARYLVTYANEYRMENINSIDIPFTSSHACTVEILSAKWTDFSDNQSVERNLAENSYKGNKDQKVTVNPHGFFTLSHTLDNDFSINNDKYDVSPIVFTVKIYHSDDPEHYSKTMTIIQDPAIIISAIDNAQGNTNSNRFYNGSLNNATNLGGIYGVNGQTTNMFVITVTALPDDSPYMLGDPRTNSPVSWEDESFFGTTNVNLASGADIDGDGKTMKYYYPTREDGTADNVISPSFCTASAWSRCSSYSNSATTLHKRAAVYQENGRPAGRWRFLSQAEAAIVAKLNHDNKIPQLFSDTNNFLVAGGYIKNGVVTKSTTATGSVRLCYDEWYWSNSQFPTCPKTTFTWGDMPR